MSIQDTDVYSGIVFGFFSVLLRFSFVHFAFSMVLNAYLTSAIVWQLLMRKIETQTVLGPEHGKHYNILTVLFVESALMNVVCSVFLLISNIVMVTIHSTQMSPVWDGMFQFFLAITPAVQVRYISSVLLLDYSELTDFFGRALIT